MNDKSFFQFYFLFDDEGLVKAKLAYYPFPVASIDTSEELLEYFDLSGNDILETYYFGLQELYDIGIVASNNSHLRLDFDRSVSTHSKSHLQYAGINEMRIPFEKLIDPVLFVEFVLSNIGSWDCLKDIFNSAAFVRCKSSSVKSIVDLEEISGLHLDFNA
jgi:hypothetical protein